MTAVVFFRTQIICCITSRFLFVLLSLLEIVKTVDSVLSTCSREENKSKGMHHFNVYSFLFMSHNIPPTGK